MVQLFSLCTFSCCALRCRSFSLFFSSRAALFQPHFLVCRWCKYCYGTAVVASPRGLDAAELGPRTMNNMCTVLSSLSSYHPASTCCLSLSLMCRGVTRYMEATVVLAATSNLNLPMPLSFMLRTLSGRPPPNSLGLDRPAAWRLTAFKPRRPLYWKGSTRGARSSGSCGESWLDLDYV